MTNQEFDANYWNERWKSNETQWDIGYPSTPLKTYIDQLTDKNLRILIPGAGNAYEGIYLLEKGFHNTYILDISPEPLQNIREKNKFIDAKNLIQNNFFNLTDTFDLILEQTFFCALNPNLRPQYVQQCKQLLNPSGKLVGVLFNDTLNTDHPPFGGHKSEYETLFKHDFTGSFDACYNSIKPRENRELFIKLTRK